MRKIIEYIQEKLIYHQQVDEKLIINKDSKIKSPFSIELDKSDQSDGRYNFTDDEIDIIISTVKNEFWPEITPICISNLRCGRSNHKLEQSYGTIFLFYSDEWRNKVLSELDYIIIHKAPDNDIYMTAHYAGTEYNAYESKQYYKNIKDALDEFLNSKAAKNLKFNK